MTPSPTLTLTPIHQGLFAPAFLRRKAQEMRGRTQ